MQAAPGKPAVDGEIIGAISVGIKPIKAITQATPEKSAAGDENFTVEKIIGKGMLNGQRRYKVKWLGYDDPADDTWESIDNCHSCKEAIADFEEENPGIKPTELELIIRAGGVRIIRPKKSQGRKRSKQLINNNKPKPAEADEADPGVNLDIDGIPLVMKEQYNLEKEGMKVLSVLGMTKLEDKKMALLTYTDGSAEFVPTDVIREHKHKEARSLVLKYLLAHVEFEY